MLVVAAEDETFSISSSEGQQHEALPPARIYLVTDTPKSFIIQDVLKRSGVNQLKPGQKRRDVMPSHGWRKFFVNQCDRANMNYSIREQLLGHKLPYQDRSYSRKTEEDILAAYTKAIPLLTIKDYDKHRLIQENKDLKTTQTQEIARLKAELEASDSQHSTDLHELRLKFDEYMARIMEVEAGMELFKRDDLKEQKEKHLKTSAEIRADIAKRKQMNKAHSS